MTIANNPRILEPSAEIVRAAEILRCGGLVAFPTETVYGLGADAENDLAVRRIFAAKGRPADHPLIVHLAEAAAIEAWAHEIPPEARTLAERFWPGPLTLILKRNQRAAAAVTGGLPTIGLRVPEHPAALALLRSFGGGIAAPSANRFGRVSPTSAPHVREELGDRVDLIVDGGSCAVGVESTILDLSGEEPCLLRPGAITAEEIVAAIGRPLGDPARNSVKCSGRLESHYAPAAGVEIVAEASLLRRVSELRAEGRSFAILCETPPLGAEEIPFIRLSRDPLSAARELYAALREIDRFGVELALVVAPAPLGIGAAVADRLAKASAKRNEK